ncbi:MAG: hypothetical protein P1S60_08895 [Anaerolineae bacterium]|nr:hypothetical protein [Anaerolineae bacterium]
MQGKKETALWQWLLFDAGLPANQAKQLLLLLAETGFSLQDFLTLTPDQLKTNGLDAYQHLLDRQPQIEIKNEAIRWNDPFYPPGLTGIPVKYRPALLFVIGNTHLLEREMVFLIPGEIPDAVGDLASGTIEILFDSRYIPVALDRSPQADLLLSSMAYGDGEAILCVDQGMENWQPSTSVATYIKHERLLALSPMPPATPANPKLTPVITALMAASAVRWVGTPYHHPIAGLEMITRPTLCLVPGPATVEKTEPNVTRAADISDAIAWLQDAEPLNPGQSDPALGLPTVEKQPVDNTQPPLSRDAILAILETGGKIPEVLLKRLRGE